MKGDLYMAGKRISEAEREIMDASKGNVDVGNMDMGNMDAFNLTEAEAQLAKQVEEVEALDKQVHETAQDAKDILERAAKAYDGAQKKILIKGKATVSLEAAKVFAQAGVDLVGNESQTVGPEDEPMEVHLVLLGAEVVLLEGIRLAAVPDGTYFLNCVPLNLTNTDGAPCRATLMDLQEDYK